MTLTTFKPAALLQLEQTVNKLIDDFEYEPNANRLYSVLKILIEYITDTPVIHTHDLTALGWQLENDYGSPDEFAKVDLDWSVSAVYETVAEERVQVVDINLTSEYAVRLFIGREWTDDEPLDPVNELSVHSKSPRVTDMIKHRDDGLDIKAVYDSVSVTIAYRDMFKAIPNYFSQNEEEFVSIHNQHLTLLNRKRTDSGHLMETTSEDTLLLAMHCQYRSYHPYLTAQQLTVMVANDVRLQPTEPSYHDFKEQGWMYYGKLYSYFLTDSVYSELTEKLKTLHSKGN